MKFIFNFLTFGVYLRLLLEIFFRSYIVASMEIYNGNDRSTQELKLSYMFSWLFVAFWCSFYWFVFFHWLSQWYINELDEESKFSELYAEIKLAHIPRVYNIIFISKRILFVLLVSFLSDLALLTKIAIFTWGNILSYVHLISSYPFKSLKDNMMEIIMESFYLFISIFMWVYNTRNNWKSFWTYLIIGCVLWWYLWTTIVGSVFLYKNMKKTICNWINRSKNQESKFVLDEDVARRRKITDTKLNPHIKVFTFLLS